MKTILAIESSCDDTSIAVLQDKSLIYHRVLTQSIHAKWGGVVPEIAAREHLVQLMQLLEELPILLDDIDVVAYTKGPGLTGSLLIGSIVANMLACILEKPALGINHLDGHIQAIFLEDRHPGDSFLAVLVSGGHTILVGVENFNSYKILAQTIDDSMGEAFDKTAKLLGISYPGGAELEKLALSGESGAVKFEVPMQNTDSLDLSFSGLKTKVAQYIKKNEITDSLKSDVAFALQEVAFDFLLDRVVKILNTYKFSSIVLVGGVAANKTLRDKLGSLSDRYSLKLFYPRSSFCTDNAAMIASAAMRRLDLANFDYSGEVYPRWSLFA